uniref:Uncharacterized protein n=2 Tax=Ixodes scapularis TaxID=6945 RepID=A0A1S4KR68_IXOSC
HSDSSMGWCSLCTSVYDFCFSSKTSCSLSSRMPCTPSKSLPASPGLPPPFPPPICTVVGVPPLGNAAHDAAKEDRLPERRPQSEYNNLEGNA